MSEHPSSTFINVDFDRVSVDVVRSAQGYASSILADVAGRRGGLNGRIRPMTPAVRFAGPAFTVDVRPGDNLMIHAAMSLIQPGDVLVVDGKGDLNSALVGAIMISACKRLRIAGVVIDGAVRDIDELAAIGLPVFAAGANPNGPTKGCPGRINAPIACGGVTVRAGDLVVGDRDGVTVIESQAAAFIVEMAARKVAEEQEIFANISAANAGQFAWTPGWLDAALRAANVIEGGQSITDYRNT